MALDLGTIITAVEAVQKAIELCKRVEDLPEQMKALGKRMEQQNTVLLRVESFVKKYATGIDPILEDGQRTDLMRIIGNIKENADKVYALFERVEKGVLSAEHGLEFRSKMVARVWYALVERPGENIEGIMEDISHDRRELSDYVNIVSAEIGARNLILLKAKEKEDERREKEKEREKERLKKAAEVKAKEKDKAKAKEKEKEKAPGASQNKPATAATATANTPSKGTSLEVATKKKPRPSPSPSPLPLRQDYKILFVDPRNQARSVVAQSILLLLGALTTTTLQSTKPNSKPWRISQVHSAGFFVSHKSTLTPSITSTLNYSHKSYKMGPFEGNEPPNPVALDAVFDNKSYPYPFKSTIQKRISNRRSVGLTENAFKEYDYIVVFTNREHDNMVRLKDALIKLGKLSVRGEGGKGRVLHLGTYIPLKNGRPREIVTVTARKEDGQEDRGDWNLKVAQIRTALKGFLREEMGWVMPDRGELELGKEIGNGNGKGKGKESLSLGVGSPSWGCETVVK